MNAARCLSVLLFGLLVASGTRGAERWRFIVTCDSRHALTGVNEPVLAELAAEIVRQGVDFLLYPGDLVHGVRVTSEQFERQLWNWVAVMRPVYDAGIPVYVCRGNHEVGDVWDLDPGVAPDPSDNHSLRWLHVFGNSLRPELMLPDDSPAGEEHMTYAFVHKNALIVALDQYGGLRHRFVHSVNQRWLDERLGRNTQPHVFVFGHEPAFRTYHYDCLDAYPAQRDAFWQSIQQAGGRTYFCGHDHYYDHGAVDDRDGVPDNDVHQLIVATAGAPFYTWEPPYRGDNSYFVPRQLFHVTSYGYILVAVDGPDVTLTWMERRGGDPLLLSSYVPAEVWGYTVGPKPVVLYPNGAERLAASQPCTVQWQTVGGAGIDEVVIEYSANGGATWTFVDHVAGSGAYEWTVPAVDSETCLLRVRDGSRPQVYDVSDRPFSIARCLRKFQGDLDGDCCVDFADLAILLSEWLACGDPFDPAAEPPP
jgi:3',5'-cyclic AMP phosphodiesterase CpdA